MIRGISNLLYLKCKYYVVCVLGLFQFFSSLGCILWTLRLQIVYPSKLMAFKVNQSIHIILLPKRGSPGSHR